MKKMDIEKVVADLRAKGGDDGLVDIILDLYERGLIVPTMVDGEQGWVSTDLGKAMLETGDSHGLLS